MIEGNKKNKKSFGLGVLKGNNFKNGFRKGSSFRSQNSGNGYQKMISSINSKTLCRECNRYHLGQCPKGEDICFWCKKSRHFAKNCPSVSTSQPRDQGILSYSENQPKITLGEEGPSNLKQKRSSEK